MRGPNAESREPIWITGVSVGLPGRRSRVFADDGVARLLAGECLIEPVPEAVQDRIAAKRITRLVKPAEAEPYFTEVTGREGVVKLAAQRGIFDLRDYGLDEEWLLNADISYQLAIAAGLECLRDARIPLQPAFKRTTTGRSLPAGWMLPPPLQDDTAVIFATAYPGHNMLSAEYERYYAATYGAMTARALREQYMKRLDTAGDEDERLAADQWFVEQRAALHLPAKAGSYAFNRNFLADYVCMGNARFAQLVRARGPNITLSAACCSTSAALATAEDLIRCGRAARVVVLAADDATSEAVFDWIGAGFLAAGAAATDRDVEDAAIPFDRRRHGMIVGMGAVGFVVEPESAARERGLEPAAELLGTRVANSASHLTRPDADHVAREMDAFLADVEARHGLSRRDLAAKTVYVSHETFTLPKGGIGAVEVQMLKRAFGDRWRDVVVVNTKCMTGHAQGAALEDAVIIKALEAGQLPPVLYSKEPDPDLEGIQLSKGGRTDREYALRFSAGFGSQIAMSLARVPAARGASRVASESRYQAWLEEVTGLAGATVEVVDRVLRVKDAPGRPAVAAPGAAPSAVTRPVAAPPLAVQAETTKRFPPTPRSETDTLSLPRPAATPAVVARAVAAPPMAVQAETTKRFPPTPRSEGDALSLPSPAATAPAGASAAPVASHAAALPPTADITESVLSVIEEKTGYEREALDLDLDLEADLGIDTIKQAQVMARLRETFHLPKDPNLRVKDFPTLRHVVEYVRARTDGPAIAGAANRAVPAAAVEAATGGTADVPGPIVARRGDAPANVEATAPAGAGVQAETTKRFPPTPPRSEANSPTPPSEGDALSLPSPAATAPAGASSAPVASHAAGLARTADITESVLSVIEEKTGYEREALELDLDLEADLGIDTIKQAQVMARLRETFHLPKDPNVRVKDFPTLRHVVNYVHARLDGAAAVDAGIAPEASSDPPAAHPAPGPVPPTESIPTVAADTRPASSLPERPVSPASLAPVDVPLAGRAAPAARPPLEPAATSAPPAAGDAVPASDVRARVLETVLGIIEQQTGYEREALELELDLEADLGIDTIKQAQAMARIREEFGLPRDAGVRVKDFPTLRHVVDYIAGRLSAQEKPALAPPATETPVTTPPAPALESAGAAPGGVRRMAVRWTSVGLDQEAPNTTLGAGWSLLLTDDGLGVAEALAANLRAAGARVEIAREQGEVEAAASRLGRVRGLILLHPLAADPSVAALDAASWRDVLDRKVVGTFRTVKALRGTLELVAAATAMAGPFGWRGQLVDPAGAGVSGVPKALRGEMDHLLVKVVDLERPATRAEAESVAATMLQEIERGGRRVEVGYRDDMRLVPSVVPEPVDLSASPRLALGPESVVIAFGGSRGVTAAVARELARRYRLRLWLTGTRPLPGDVAELAALDAQGLKDLKAKITRGWKARMTRSKPIEIEREFEANLRAIEAHRTVEACRAAGATVSYASCDVRDPEAVSGLVRSVARRSGRLDGLIFGAGTIEDKLIEDKTVDSFRRVFGVKAEGIFNVYKALDGINPSFLAGFSSVAGRFGNAGQSDYAAGNEVLARFITLMHAARPENRLVALDWTGWEDVGLAARSGAIDLLKAAGLEALSPAEGARLFQEEMVFGAGADEIVYAGGIGPGLDKDGQVVPLRVPGSPPDADGQLGTSVFLDVRDYAKGAWLTARASLDSTRHPWLLDHVIDGAPLVPAVFGIEMMAEAASLLFPGFHFCGVRDLKLHLAAKSLKDRPIELKIAAAARMGATDDERVAEVRVTSDFTGPGGRILIADRLHYTASVVLRPSALPSPAVGPAPPTLRATPGPRLYGEGGMLPHGPAFRVLESVDLAGDGGAVGRVTAASAHRTLLPSSNGHGLLTMPFAREAAFQAAGVWAIVRHTHFGLPHGCRSLTHFAAPPPDTTLSVRVTPKAVGPVRIEYDIDIVGDDGRLYDRMERFYTVNPLRAAEVDASSESEGGK